MREMTLRAVIERTIQILTELPRDLPQAPDGWTERAESALADGSEHGLIAVGLEMRVAHSQYPAEFDHRIALYELREVLPLSLRAYAAMGVVPTGVVR